MQKYTKRKDGRYVAKIVINGQAKYLYSRDSKQLDKMIIEYKYEAEKGLIINTQDMTFEELADKWFESKQKRKEYNTRLAIQRKLKNHIYPALGHLKIKNIKSYNVQNLINDLVPKYAGYVGVFWGNDIDGYRYIVGSSTLDCRELATTLREKFGAKGGGKAPMIQGNVSATQEQLKTIILH